jgi:hypothetical protein
MVHCDPTIREDDPQMCPKTSANRYDVRTASGSKPSGQGFERLQLEWQFTCVPSIGGLRSTVEVLPLIDFFFIGWIFLRVVRFSDLLEAISGGHLFSLLRRARLP